MAWGSAQVSVGSNLSYEDEAIVCGRRRSCGDGIFHRYPASWWV